MSIEQKRGLGRDIDRLKEHGGASAAELREFMQQIKGKSPQEVLGVMAASSLVQSCILATIGCAIVMAALTVGPYAWNQMSPPAKPAAAAPATAAAATTPGAPNPAAAPQAALDPNKTPTAALPAPDGMDPTAASKPRADEDLLDKLGVGETREADPNANPLDNDKDDLLKELK